MARSDKAFVAGRPIIRHGWFATWRAVLFFASLLLAPNLVASAQAQIPSTSGASKSELEKLIAEAHEKGVRVVIVDPEKKTVSPSENAEPPLLVVLEREAVEARGRLAEVLRAAPTFLDEASKVVAEKSAMSKWWPLRVLFRTLVFLGIGWGVERLYRAWARKQFLYTFDPKPCGEAEKIAYLYTRGGLEVIGVFIQVAIAGLLVIIFDGGVQHLRQTAFLVIAAVAILRLIHIFLRSFLAPHTPTHHTYPHSSGSIVS